MEEDVFFVISVTSVCKYVEEKTFVVFRSDRKFENQKDPVEEQSFNPHETEVFSKEEILTLEVNSTLFNSCSIQ